MKQLLHLCLLVFTCLFITTCRQTPDSNNPVNSQVMLKPPKSLSVKSFSQSEVLLSWAYEVDYSIISGETLTVDIEQSVEGGAFSVIKNVPITQTSAALTGNFSIESTYTYRTLIKTSSANKSTYSGTVTQNALITTMEPPANLSIQSFSSSSIVINWTISASYSSLISTGLSVEIEQSINDSAFTLFKSVPLSQNSAIVNGKYSIVDKYSFRARIKTLIRSTIYSNVVAQTILAVPTMVYVSGGTFRMGSASGYSNEQPVHTVTVKSFYISMYETTVKQYRAYTAGKKIAMPTAPSWGWNDNEPMVNVSWNDATAYCQWLSQITGKSVRLPTEAEWEFGARGGTLTHNYTYSGSDTITDVAVHNTNKPSNVGTKQKNELGLYDMSGNAWEWVNDWYGPYPSTSQTNPTGPTSGSYRIFRGGSSFRNEDYCRVSLRVEYPQTEIDIGVGFRIVQD